MDQNKLIKKLIQLNRKEMTRFLEFAHSPYYNKHQKVTQLLEILESYYPKFTKKNCDRHQLFKILFPEEKTHDQSKLALIFTYSIKLLEIFFATERFSKNEFLQNLYLLQELRERQLLGFYEKKLGKQEESLEKQDKRNGHFYFQRYLLADEADQYFMRLSRHEKDNNIQDKQDFLDKFFLSEKLKDACEMTVRGKILRQEYNPSLLQPVLQEVENHWEKYKDVPTISIYYWIFMLVNGGPQDTFFTVRKVLNTQHQAFTYEELQSLYNYLQHYCIEQINKGFQNFLHELFKLYQTQLIEGFLLEDNQLSEWHYKNIVTTGLRLNETSWVNDFIEQYKEQLPPASLENAYTFNKASYYYEVQEFDKVLELLIRVEYTDIRYSLGAKALLLRTYYDTDEFEAFTSLSDSFKQFLLRNMVISDSRREGFSNLIRFARKSFQLKVDKGFISKEKFERDLKKLKEEIKQSKVLFNQNWLMQKIQLLED